MMPAPPSTPRWFTAMIILLMLPLFQFPFLLGRTDPGTPARVMLWVYPFYALVAGYLAWQCYPQRHALAWILLVLLVLSHASIWYLCTSTVTPILPV